MQLDAAHLETQKNDTNQFLRLKELYKDLLVNVRIILDTAQNDPTAIQEVIASLRDKIESSQEYLEELIGPDVAIEEK